MQCGYAVILKHRLDFDWTQARAFLATAEAGSFSGGARALGLTQPTLSRQVAALEADLGVTLFERVGNGLSLTETGLGLLDHVRAMAEGAERVVLTASGKAQDVAGPVTITATDLVAMYLLPPALRRIRAAAPGISIEILASNAIQDLRRREADISIRHVRPSEPDLIGRSLGTATASLWAASGYLDGIGRPATPDALAERADFLGFGFASLEELVPQLRAHGVPVTEGHFRLGSFAPAVTWDFVRQGLGVSMMMDDIGERTPGVERALPKLKPETYPYWLVAHREVHTSRRIRLVFDILAETLRPGSATGQQPPQAVGGRGKGGGVGSGGG